MKNKKFSFFALIIAFICSICMIAACTPNATPDNGDNPSLGGETEGDSSGDDGNNADDGDDNEGGTESDDGEDVGGYEIVFDCDGNVTVYVYETQDDMTNGVDTEPTTTAYSRNSETGEPTKNGSGQVNYLLVFADGYVLDDIQIVGLYNNNKGSADTGVENGFRITKIESDLTVTVTSKKADEAEDLTQGYEVTFDCDEHVSVLVYKTQDMSGDGEATTTAYSRDSGTGKLTKDGSGQVNYVLVFEDGYALEDILIEGGYTNNKGSADTGIENGFRITKITSDLTVTVVSRSTSVAEDLSQGYEVTFDCDEHVSVLVYRTQDMSRGGEATTTAYSRDEVTGKLTKDGSGQVNYVLVFDEGYELNGIQISGEYTNNKGPVDTGVDNGYRITKILSDLTVSVTSKDADAEEDLTQGYEVIFNCGAHVSVLVYRTQDMSGDGEATTTAYSRDSSTGRLTKDGSGQVNFVIVFDDGYELDEIFIDDSTACNAIKDLSDTVVNGIRITKITNVLTVTITAKKTAAE